MRAPEHLGEFLPGKAFYGHLNGRSRVAVGVEEGSQRALETLEEACVLLSHPYFANDMKGAEALVEALRTSFGGRFPGRIEDPSSEAGAVWQVVLKSLHTQKLH